MVNTNNIAITAALFQAGVAIPIWALEAEVFVLAIVYFIIGRKILNNYQSEMRDQDL